MIANIWAKVIENGELSTNFIIVAIVIFGIATDFFATRDDLQDIRERLEGIESNIVKVRTKNIISEKDLNQVQSDLKSNKEKIKSIRENNNKLVNKHSKIQKTIKYIDQNQNKIEEKIESYHDN